MDQLIVSLILALPNHKMFVDTSSTSENEKDCVIELPYRQILGGHRYLMTCMRPNIDFVIGLLSRFTQNLEQQHTKALKKKCNTSNTHPNMVLCINIKETIHYKSMDDLLPIGTVKWIHETLPLVMCFYL